MAVKVVMYQWMRMAVQQLHQLEGMVVRLEVKGVVLASVVQCPLERARMELLRSLLQLERRHSRQSLPSISTSMYHHPIRQLCKTGVVDVMTLSMSTAHSLSH